MTTFSGCTRIVPLAKNIANPLVEIQHLKQSSASNEDCKKTQAEIEHLRQNGVSKRFSALGMAAFATCSRSGTARRCVGNVQ